MVAVGPRLLDLAAAEHDDAVGDLGDDGEVVRDIDAGHAARAHHRLEGAQHLDLGGHVEGGGGLVEDHELRAADQRHRRREALQLAAGDLVGVALADRLGVGQGEGAEERDGAAAGLRHRHQAVDAGDLDHLVDDDAWPG